MSEKAIDEEQVRAEHLAEVRPSLQWAILGVVFGGATALMLLLIAILGAT